MRDYFSATPPTGSPSITSTGCASMPRRASTTARAEHILAVIAQKARAAAGGRAHHPDFGERAAGGADWSGRPTTGGYGLDALWNDDFHHSAVVALTGRREAYYSGSPRNATGVHLGGEARLSVSGAALRVAEEGARHPHRRCAARRLRRLPREPRSGGQLRRRLAPPSAHRAGRATGR